METENEFTVSIFLPLYVFWLLYNYLVRVYSVTKYTYILVFLTLINKQRTTAQLIHLIITQTELDVINNCIIIGRRGLSAHPVTSPKLPSSH